MKQTCPFCEKKTSALKNHVRQSGGGGHAPSGQYPDDFEAGSTTDRTRPAQGGTDAGQRAESGERDETTPIHERFCDFCEETGHGVFECSEREDWHEDQALPEAARRLDPVCRDP